MTTYDIVLVVVVEFAPLFKIFVKKAVETLNVILNLLKITLIFFNIGVLIGVFVKLFPLLNEFFFGLYSSGVSTFEFVKSFFKFFS